MKGLILAAGRGTRLGRHAVGLPKCLLELNGRTLLERQVAALRAAGAAQVGAVGGWRHDLLEGRSLEIFVNPHWASTTMVESLACARRWLSTEEVLVSYGDIVYSAAAAKCLAKIDAPIAIAYDPNWLELWKQRFAEPLSDAETFAVDSSGAVVEIGRRPSSLDEVRGQYMGLLRFTPRGWQEVETVIQGLDEQVRVNTDMTSLLGRIVDCGRLTIAGVPILGPWCEFDSPLDLAIGLEIVRRLDSEGCQLMSG